MTVAAVLAGLIGSIALSLALIYYTVRFPDPIALRQRDSAPIVRVLAADGSALAERGEAYDFIPFDLLPRHVIDAVLAIEDRRFFEHHGLDPVGLAAGDVRQSQGGALCARRLHADAAAGQEPVPDFRAVAPAQDRGADAGCMAGGSPDQAGHPRALSQPGLLRQRRLRHRSGGAALFRQVGAQSHAWRGRRDRRPAQGALEVLARLEPRAWPGRADALSSSACWPPAASHRWTR